MATTYGDSSLLPTLSGQQKGGNQTLIGVDSFNTLIGTNPLGVDDFAFV